MDVEDTEQKTITLLIKTPNQAQEDQAVEGVCPNWTVKDLKRHLSIVYTTKPATSDQRLIYGGKLLPDHLPIKDLFRQTDSFPTLHLVCATRTPAQGPLGARPKFHNPALLNQGCTTSKPKRQSSPVPPVLRQALVLRVLLAPHPQSSPQLTLTEAEEAHLFTFSCCSSHTSPPVSTSMACCSSVSLHRCSSQPSPPTLCTAPSSSCGSSMFTLDSITCNTMQRWPQQAVPVPAPLANQNPIENLPANQNPVQDGAFINPGEANQNMRMNAQGGPVMEDEDDVERDWLDWMYSAARFGVLLMIVYFNSNLSRFLLVMSTLLLMYLHTVGWFPFRRRAQVQGPNPLQPPEVQHNQQNENRNPNAGEEPADRQREEPAAEEGGSEGHGPMAAVLVPPYRVSVMWTAWVFLKTFFSSLIPEVAQGMAN
ncbi:hypothetical protein JOQ06_003334 [Pogonophryne albipinna]|uniref:Ubiquitin-like domain-containing protein n=1 Tax=Pogonophryne albipinna TaxID=1090488 RepID=A0AAD6B9L8_9TELE|nr:hypothetical protein JOQ06_003334 [Pogonophryne albipinna]